MPITWAADEIEILEGAICSYAGLVRIATPDPVRLWTGVGSRAIVDSAFDPDNTVFLGAGRIIDLPTFQRMWNGLAERITITLTGVTDEMRDLVYTEADDVRGATVRLGFIALGERYHQIGPVYWLRRGRCDTIETDNRPGERERIKTISLSIGSQLTGRKVPGVGVYTSSDQQMRAASSTDRFCERTPLMTQTHVQKWPTH